MNRTNIEWVKNPDGTQGFTWNPVTGCEHGCPYCYARRIAARFGNTNTERKFQPMFHDNRLLQPLERKKPARIFVCSMADLFGAWVPYTWILRVLHIAHEAPQHTFQFLTKNPERYNEFKFPENCWLGATVTDHASAEAACWAMCEIQGLNITYFSAEPLLGSINLHLLPWVPDWIIIGAQTGPGASPLPDEWVRGLTMDAIECMSVFHKNSLGEQYRLHVFPERR